MCLFLITFRPLIGFPPISKVNPRNLVSGSMRREPQPTASPKAQGKWEEGL